MLVLTSHSNSKSILSTPNLMTCQHEIVLSLREFLKGHSNRTAYKTGSLVDHDGLHTMLLSSFVNHFNFSGQQRKVM